MKYACFQYQLFYKRVLLVLLVPGLSHMAADKATAQSKTALMHKNSFSRGDVASVMSSFKRITCKFIEHANTLCPACIGLKSVLDKMLSNMVIYFRSNYV